MTDADTDRADDAADEQDLEALLDEMRSGSGLAHAESPSDSASDDSPGDEDEPDELSLVDAIAESYEAIEAGERSSNLSFRDADLAAALAGLEATGDLSDLAREAQVQAGKEGEDLDLTARSTVLKYLIRVGLNEVDDEVAEAARDAKILLAERQADF